ncbi:MAG: response regulator transcription factor [Bacteroidetes bacterium]|jgi:DNA-binding response OmpR family regulator|nr:response regulator transcription factor [Bacteroidota bacterium]
MKKILLVEDDANVASLIMKGLVEEGYEVSLAPDGEMGYNMATQHSFNLIMLDIMLPNRSGLEVCRDIRSANVHTPILFLTALSTAENAALGLNMGGDDYLVKPFKFVELLARINALLRRSTSVSAKPVNTDDVYTIADLTVDDKAKTVTRSGTAISLTATEYRLLLVLIKNKGRVLSRMDLLEAAWDINFNANTNVVDVYINYLRKKVEGNSETKLIHTVIGMGYVLKEA